MANIYSLPTEILHIVLSHSSSPEALFSLVKAYPKALNCFLADRQHSTKTCVGALSTRFGDILSISNLLAARLRHARQDEGFLRRGVKEAEKKIWPIVDATAWRKNLEKGSWHQMSLSALCALSSLVNEAEWIITSYPPLAWEKATMEPTGRFRTPGSEFSLSSNERDRFLNAICQFESYCQTFFLQDDLLFKRDHEFRRRFFDPYGIGKERTTSSNGGFHPPFLRFYSIVYFIYDQHCTMLRNVAENLATKAPPRTSNEALEMKRIRDHEPFVRVQSCLEVCRFQHRSRTQLKSFAQFLTSQGVGMLLKLQSMTLEQQTAFTLSSFFDVSTSHHPFVLITLSEDDFPYYDLGTCEQENWNPWVFSETVHSRYLEGIWDWRLAWQFWDVTCQPEFSGEGDDGVVEGWMRRIIDNI